MKKQLLFIVALLLVALGTWAQSPIVFPGNSLSGSFGGWSGTGYFYSPTFNVNATGGIDITYYDIDLSQLRFGNSWELKGYAEPGVSKTNVMTSIDPNANTVWCNLMNMEIASGNDWSGKPISTLGPDGLPNTNDDTRHGNHQDWFRGSSSGKVNGPGDDIAYNNESYVTPNPRYPSAAAKTATEINSYDFRLRILPTGTNTYTYEMWVRLHNAASTVEGATWIENKAINNSGANAAWRAFEHSGTTIFPISNIDLSSVYVFMGLGNGNTASSQELAWGKIEVKGTPTSAPSTVWVDGDYYAGGTNDGHVWGYDAFATISNGISAVAEPGTVNVAAGTYTEALTIGKSLTLIGSGPSNSPTTIITSTGSRTITLSVTGKSFSFQNLIVEGVTTNNGIYAGSSIDLTSLSLQNVILRNCQVGLYLSERYPLTTTVGTLSMDNVTLLNNKFIGAYIGKTVLSGTVTNSTVTGNGYSSDLPASWQKTGLQFVNFDEASVPHVTVTNSTFSNNGAGASDIERTGLILYTAYNALSTNEIMTVSGCSFTDHPLYAVRIKNGYNVGNTATVNGTFTNNYLDIWFNNIVGTTSSTTNVRRTFTGIRTVGVGPTYDYSTIQAAINAATAGDVIEVAAGTYVESGQIVINKNLTITGADKATTSILPSTDFTSNTTGWFIINSGVTLNLSKVKLDGTGRLLTNGMLFEGNGVIDDCAFYNIKNGLLEGSAIRIYNTADVDVTNCLFTEIGRNGVRHRGTGNIQGNTYTGKGTGNWLDYFALAEYGCNITINGNTVTNCLGVAYDGSGSAAFAVWDDENTTVGFTNNIMTGNTCGIGFAAINSIDPTWEWPHAIIGAGNIISGGDEGISFYAYSGSKHTPVVTISGTSISSLNALNIGSGVVVNNIDVNGNSLVATTGFGVANSGTGSLDATCNWFGTADYNTILTKVSGDVDFVNYLVTNDLVTQVCTGDVWPVHNTTKNLYYQTIQAAITAATAGDVIEVAAGTYNYLSEGSPAPSGLIKVTKGVTLKGAAGARPIIDGTDFDGVFKIHPSALNPGNTVIIEGFEIKGNAATGIAMTMQGCFNVTPAKVIIRDNWFHGMVGGIDFWGAGAYLPSGWTSALANVEITGNKFYDMVTAGPYPGFGVMIEDPANWATAGNDHAVKIENNEFSNLPTNGANPGVGIVMTRANDTWEAANLFIKGNIFNSTVPVGVAFQDGDVTHAQVVNNSFNNSVYGILASGIDNGPIDAECNWFGTTDYNTILTKVSGDVDFVNYLFTNDIVTPVCTGDVWPVHDVTQNTYYQTIQAAISGATAGDVIEVAAGTYNEYNINVNKPLTLKGANANVAWGSRGAESKVQNADGYTLFNVLSDGVTINGFEITGPQSNNAIYNDAGGHSNVTIKFNYIHDIGTLRGSGSIRAIHYMLGLSANSSNVTISDNYLNNIGNTTSLEGSADAIWFGPGTNPGTVTNVNIERNIISNVNSVATGRGSRGILVTTGAGSITNPVIRYNNITNLAGPSAQAIRIDGNTPGAIVTNNLINNINSTDNNAAGVYTNLTSGFNTLAVNNNSFINVKYGVQNSNPNLINATCNWYGENYHAIDNNGTNNITPKISGNVTYSPWLPDGSNSASIGFEPTAECNGSAISHNRAYENIKCYGEATGSVSVNPTGGVLPYTYLWNTGATTNGITGLIAGPYSVTITDAVLATATYGRTLTQPAAPLSIVLDNKTDVLCYGQTNGAINVSVSGGTTPYTYAWMKDGASFAAIEDLSTLGAGLYDLTVTDANLCTSLLATVTIAQPDIANGWVRNMTQSGHPYYCTIQEAIDAATAGDVINVGSGTYNEAVNVTKANLTIQGAGATLTYITTTTTTPGIIVTSNGAVIKNLGITNAAELIEGIRVSTTVTGLTVDHVNFTNIGNGTWAWDGGPWAYGIHLMGSLTNLNITNCTFDALSATHTANGVYSELNTTLTDFTLENCTFNLCWNGLFLQSNIAGLQAKSNTFGPQELTDMGACVAGIYIGDGPTPFSIDQVLIEENTFTSYGRGIYFCDYNTGSYIGAIEIKNNTFTNSIFSSGIRLMAYDEGSGSATLVGPVSIDNNTFTQSSPIVNGNGVAMIDLRVGAESATTNSVGVTNNHITFTGTFTLSTWGMVFRGPIRNINITGNTLNGNDAGGASPNMPATSGIVLQSNYSGFGPMSSSAHINISNNGIQGFVHGVAVYDFISHTYGGIPTGANVDINNNSIISNTTGIYSGAGETIDATLNYWGSCPSVSGPATYFPYWSTVSGTPGSFSFGGSISNITASASETTICLGQSVTLSAGNGSNFEWFDGTGASLGYGVTKVVAPASTGDYTYTLRGTDTHGCAGGETTVLFTVNPEFVAEITKSTGSGPYTLTATAGSSYLWSTGDITRSISVNPSVTTTYSVLVTSGTCSDLAEITIDVVSVNAGSDQVICAGGSATLTVNVSGLTNPTFAWTSDPAPGAPYPNTQSIMVSPETTTTFSVTVDAGGTEYSDDVVVTLRLAPVADAGPDKTIFVGQLATLAGSATGGTPSYSYVWTPGGMTTATVTVIPASTTTYTLNVTDAYGCMDPDGDQVLVTVNPIPPTGNTVTGNVAYAFGTINAQMHNVDITLTGTGSEGTFTGTTAPTGNGNYSIPGVPDGTYTASLYSPKPWGGVDNADVTAIANHYRPSRPVILHGIKRLAADVVGNSSAHTVNVSDRNQVMAKVNHPSTSFATGDWVFTKAGDISSTSYPLQYCSNSNSPSSTIQISVGSGSTSHNFRALCYGDVNASYNGIKESEIPLYDGTEDDWFSMINFPNPFSSQTTFSYNLPVEGKSLIEVFDLTGNRLAVLENEDVKEGVHEIYFNGRDLAPGVYLYMLSVKTSTDIMIQKGKMIVMP